MLKDKDRIFKNLYNDFGWDIESAVARGDWLQTKELISFLNQAKNSLNLHEMKIINQKIEDQLSKNSKTS